MREISVASEIFVAAAAEEKDDEKLFGLDDDVNEGEKEVYYSYRDALADGLDDD